MDKWHTNLRVFLVLESLGVRDLLTVALPTRSALAGHSEPLALIQSSLGVVSPVPICVLRIKRKRQGPIVPDPSLLWPAVMLRILEEPTLLGHQFTQQKYAALLDNELMFPRVPLMFVFKPQFCVTANVVECPTAIMTLWNTCVLDDNVRQVCDTCFQTEAKPVEVCLKSLRLT